MTILAAPILALIAGLTVTRSRAVRWVFAPWLTVLAVQTAWLAAGRGSSPASTVTTVPNVIGYLVVQAVSLGVAAWVATRLAERRNLAPVRSNVESPRTRCLAITVAGGSTLALLAATAPAPPGHGGGGATESVASMAFLTCIASGVTLEVLRRVRPAHSPTVVES